MSSKLLRGEVPAEPMSWRNLGADDGDNRPGQSSNLPAAAPVSRFAHDPEQKIRAAYQRGLQEGQAAARQELSNELQTVNTRMARTIEEATGMRQRFRHEAEEDVVALAFAIARRILHRELTVAPDALLGIVKTALEKLEAREVHRVRIRPEDAPMVKQFLDKMGLPQRVEVIADPGLDRGAAVFDSSRGTLDASVDTQLSEIERGLADLVRRA